ncbi:hypothetical protein [Nocardioides sp.]|uniref:hypothetical protein n=1 Tax=Nocardioides sp. TaxID=35761 RepID=UPI00260DAF6F|nr:hypothetical protein [Nocardioides sp.]
MSRRTRLLLLLLLVVVVNLGPLGSWWTQERLDRDGVSERVAASTEGMPEGQVVVALPPAVTEAVAPDDAAEGEEPGEAGLLARTATLEPAAYDDAVATGEVEVTWLEDDPATYRVEGEQGGTGQATLLVVNAGVLLLVAVVLLLRGRTRPELRMVATADVRRVPPGPLLERVEGNDYVVRGDVESLTEDELVLAVADRRVRVLLDGHANPASYQHSVEVRGTMIG